MRPSTTALPPSQSTISAPTPETSPISGQDTAWVRARRTLRARYSALSRSNSAISPRLHRVGAHHRHAAEVLLHLGGERAELLLHRGGAHLRVVVKALGDEHERGERRHREQGEPRIDEPHGGERAPEGERGPISITVPKPASARRVEMSLDARDIRSPVRCRVIERGRQAAGAACRGRADVVLHPLPGPQHGEARAQPGRAVGRGQGQDQEDVGADRAAPRVPLERVHRALHRPRDAQRERGGEQEAGDAPEVAEPVAVQIRQETSERRHRVSIDQPRAGASPGARRPPLSARAWRARRPDTGEAPRRSRTRSAWARGAARRAAPRGRGGPPARAACRASRSWCSDENASGATVSRNVNPCSSIASSSFTPAARSERDDLVAMRR